MRIYKNGNKPLKTGDSIFGRCNDYPKGVGRKLLAVEAHGSRKG